MNIIAAVDNNWAIGYRNDLLVRIPNDQKHFREETMGKVVVLGHRTLETFPQGMPLQGRKNIILSADRKLQIRHALVVHSLEELFHELQPYASQDIYVIGGESVYRQLLPYCDVAHITKIDRRYEADRFCLAPLPTHSHFLALAFPCTGAYKVCKTKGPLFPIKTIQWKLPRVCLCGSVA